MEMHHVCNSPFIRGGFGIELDAQRCRQHAGSQIFRVITGFFFGFTERMMLRQIAVPFLIGRLWQHQDCIFPTEALSGLLTNRSGIPPGRIERPSNFIQPRLIPEEYNAISSPMLLLFESILRDVDLTAHG